MQWLNENLKKEIRTVFEPRYKRKLTNQEVIDIASNLTKGLESILKFKCKQKYGKYQLQD